MFKRIDSWVTWGLVVFIVGVLIIGNIVIDKPKDPPKYHEETYTLLDGTPCTIVRGSVHIQAYVGITCHYNYVVPAVLNQAIQIY